MSIFNKYKKMWIISGVVLAAVLVLLYLRALFLPGIWHQGTFLYLQKDGSFIGSDLYADYKMNIITSDYGADIEFSVNDITRNYQITNSGSTAEITENGTTVFKGNVIEAGDGYLLMDADGKVDNMITVSVSGQIPKTEELFPSYSALYSIAVMKKCDIRGNTMMLFVILLMAVFLFLDIKFPDLFWILEHRLEVDGGEPSDWYRFGQKVGNVLIVIGMLVCVVLTFTTH